MKLSSRKQIESLAEFESKEFLTTSFTLNTDKSKLTKKEISLNLKNLLNNHKNRIEEMKLKKEGKDSLFQDLEKIRKFCDQSLGSQNSSGIAVFSCSNEGFWEDFTLPDPPKNRIVFDRNPYVRPLSAILGQHYRLCVLTFNRKQAKWYDVTLGEISLMEEMESDVPGKVREGGWEGYESKKIERHIAAHFHDFLKKITQKTFDIFKNNDFDWLFVGCSDEYFQKFNGLLHPYLKERMKSKLKINPSDAPSKILKQVLKLKKTLKEEEQNEMMNRFVSELEKGGLAVSGLKNTLRSLNRSEVDTLLVTRYFTMPGKMCSKCQLLFADEVKCPACGQKTRSLIDVMDEAVEAALDKKCRVMHIEAPVNLGRYGNVGALLRFKTKS